MSDAFATPPEIAAHGFSVLEICHQRNAALVTEIAQRRESHRTMAEALERSRSALQSLQRHLTATHEAAAVDAEILGRLTLWLPDTVKTVRDQIARNKRDSARAGAVALPGRT